MFASGTGSASSNGGSTTRRCPTRAKRPGWVPLLVMLLSVALWAGYIGGCGAASTDASAGGGDTALDGTPSPQDAEPGSDVPAPPHDASADAADGAPFPDSSPGEVFDADAAGDGAADGSEPIDSGFSDSHDTCSAQACSDELPCTLDRCDSNGGCAHDLAPGWCHIEGVCVAEGAAAPGDVCRRCRPELATADWSSTDDGTSCDADGSGCTEGDACRDGVCVAGVPVSCPPAAATCELDVCVPLGPTDYRCGAAPAPDFHPCPDDGDDCTEDLCLAGACERWTIPFCTTAPRPVGAPCAADADCEPGLVCDPGSPGGFCTILDCTPVTGDAPCPPGARCASHAGARAVCQPDCEEDHDCRTGERYGCGTDGSCRAQACWSRNVSACAALRTVSDSLGFVLYADATVELWFRVTSPPPIGQRADVLRFEADLSALFPGLPGPVLRVWLDDGLSPFFWTLQGSTVELPAIAPDVWHHLALTRDVAERTLTLWLDGAEGFRGRVDPVPAIAVAATAWTFFGEDAGMGGCFVGDAGDVRVSDTARYRGAFAPEPYFAVDAATVALWRPGLAGPAAASIEAAAGDGPLLVVGEASAATPSDEGPDGACPACAPTCGERECGPDGCGGTCGECPVGRRCTASGLCGPCSPECESRVCGSDGCGGTCGECASPRTCGVTGRCDGPCSPLCEGRECGPDGCGGVCGGCVVGEVCEEEAGRCDPCEPRCDSTACVADGCGGVCGGDCQSGMACFAAGATPACVAPCSPEAALCADGSVCAPGFESGTGACAPGGTAAPGAACEAPFDCERGFVCVGGVCRAACEPAAAFPVCPGGTACEAQAGASYGVCVPCVVACTDETFSLSCEPDAAGITAHNCQQTQICNEETCRTTYYACDFLFPASGFYHRVELVDCELLESWKDGLCTHTRQYCIGDRFLRCGSYAAEFEPSIESCGAALWSCAEDAACDRGVGCVPLAMRPDTCFIDGDCRWPGWFEGAEDLSPGTSCRVCVPEQDPWALTELPDGTPCRDADPCTAADSCAAGACVGTPYDCDDALGCTVDTCDGEGGCSHDLRPAACLIDGHCHDDGTIDPDDVCFSCDVAADARGWTARDDDPFGDGVDTNCDGADGVDGDRDGHANTASGGDDCDDAAPETYPTAEDRFGDGVDTNCDGRDGVDADGDEHANLDSGGDDCDDGAVQVHPGAEDQVGPVCLQAGPWTTETLGVPGGAAAPAAGLAVDADGRRYLAIIDAEANTIRLATESIGGGWSEDPIPASLPLGRPDLVVGDEGARVCFFDKQDGDLLLREARRAGDEWTIETVRDLGQYSSDAATVYYVFCRYLEGTGQGGDLPPTIFYRARSASLLARFRDGEWKPDDPALELSQCWDAALGPDGAVHACASGTYVTNASGEWESVAVELPPGSGEGCAIAVDRRGDVHIVYRRDRALHYATNAGDTWTVSALFAPPGSGFNDRPDFALAVDGWRRPHGLHRADPAPGLYYSTNAAGAWQNELLVSGGMDVFGTLTPAIVAGGSLDLWFAVTPGDGTVVLGTRACAAASVGDENCDGADGVDADGDGRASVASGGVDCDDDAAGTYPGAADPHGDGVDTDCDGVDGVDADGDGHASTGSGGADCDDGDPAVHPGAADLPSGVCVEFDYQDWSRGVVPDTAGATTRFDVAFGPDGSAWLAFCTADGALRVVSDPFGAATAETLGACVATATDVAAAVTSDGVFHVAAVVEGTLRHWWRDGDVWQNEDIAVVGTEDSPGVALAAGPGAVLHAAYQLCLADDRSVLHATRTPQGWLVEPASDPLTDHGVDVALVVDAHNDAHVAYHTPDPSGYNVYATNAGGGWIRVPIWVTSSEWYTDSHALALGPAGQLLYAYTNRVAGFHVHEDLPASTASTDLAGFTYRDIDVAFDRTGGLHVLAPTSSGYVVHLSRNGALWPSHYVDSGPNADATALAAREDGRMLLVAHDERAGVLVAYAPACVAVATAQDTNCDGVDGVDLDQDGHLARESFGRDCDDHDPDVHPSAADAPGDGGDQNCDGVDGVDADGDGWPAGDDADCDDGASWRHPGQLDLPGDGFDVDCDGQD